MGNPIIIVQGGQFGSESKGLVAGYLCKKERMDIAVRTGAVNAGHSVYYNGSRYVNQQLPVGWVNPDTRLVIGAGALIDPTILDREVREISALTGTDIRERLSIDRRAGIHRPYHAARSKDSGRHHAIGATGKGASEALVERITGRGLGYQQFGDTHESDGYDVCDTEALLNYSWNEGAKILLEGTQGQLLDLYLGPYPYTTHKQTGPAQWMLECGLSPALPTEICMVVRTYPIRVAGNSGPMPQETSWPELAREMNALRDRAGLPPLLREGAIASFEEAVVEAGKNFDGPANWSHLNQHRWSAADRLNYQAALSEVHKTALMSLPEATVKELSTLFELTTVTKKLRRIARLDRETVETAARQIRPAWVALTFANYVWPESWFTLPREWTADQQEYTRQLEEWCRASVRLVSFGPEDCHTLDRKV